MNNKFLCLLLLMFLVAIPSAALAAMDSYCSAPPYVTRTIAPNIMVLMDNSEDMLQPAYPELEYTPNGTKDNYIGYYNPQGCYYYSGGKFYEALNGTDSYTDSDTCPSTAPFRGNLMNWATMSKYDVLQKVIVGGNATSKQGNAHTLVSISGVWPVDPVTFPSTARYYNGCEFRMNNGNLTIIDHPTSGGGTCPLLVPSAGFAVVPRLEEVQQDSTLHDLLADYVSTATGSGQKFLSSVGSLWESINLVSEAWAARPCTIQTGALNGKEGEPFDLVMSLVNKEGGSTASWTAPVMPAWMTGPALDVNASGVLDGKAIWSNSQPSAGIYNFEVTASSVDGCSGTDTYTGQFVIEANPPEITHYVSDTLDSGTEGVGYTFTMTGQGGTPVLNWSITSGFLPPGLTLSSTTGVISGTPAAAGTYSFSVQLEDSLGAIDTAALKIIIEEGLEILTNDLPEAWEGEAYYAQLKAIGGTVDSSGGYTWAVSGLPSSLSFNATSVAIDGTPDSGTTGTYPVLIKVEDHAGTVVSKTLNLTVGTDPGHVVILSEAVLPTTYNGDSFLFEIQANGGMVFSSGVYAGGYKWGVGEEPGNPTGSTLPSWMTLDEYTGVLSGVPDNTVDTPYTFAIWVEGGGGHVDYQYFKLESLAKAPKTTALQSQTFAVNVTLIEEPLTDLNGNDIWDDGESFTDLNGNGVWDGKGGVFQKFWDSTASKARWGMTRFRDVGSSVEVDVDTCIPVSNAASFYTNIQNATPASSSPLASGLYSDINYYKFNSGGFTGCTNSDPIDHVPCRKNFMLVLTSGSDLSGTGFPTDSTCNESNPVVQNACYAYNNDLRSDAEGKQSIYTYIVNTMGENDTNNAILEAASNAGGGVGGNQYYEASSGSDIEDQLTKAIEDILAQAASGTAVSVLTTSSRGIGSMMQAYFLPIRQEAEREVRWTGYVQNLWIDPDDNLREDSNSDYRLKLTDDNILRLYFNEQTNEARAALFTDAQLKACTDGTMSGQPTIKDFNAVSYTWEGGSSLVDRSPSSRNLFTAKKYIHGESTHSSYYSDTLSSTDFSTANSELDARLDVASDAAAADKIIGYVRGECLESGVSGDAACADATDSTYRDRRIDGKVWKLGDVISSTPKVLAGTPNNTYHIDYGDITYYNFVSSSGTDFKDSYGYSLAGNQSYSDRSSVAFVGANDGILHAFRVGYLKDKGVTETGVLGLFKNFVGLDDSLNDKIGEEVWGYVPYNALPYLKYLADPNYCHIYYNDLSVRLVDASLGDLSTNDSADAKTEQSWKTILIGGMRFGGACEAGVPSPPGTVSNVGYSAYYAIDVTDAEHPKPLWEFSDPDMGYSTGFPSVLRTGDPGDNGRWYVAFGSGSTTLPKGGTDIARSKDGYLYVLDLETGVVAQKIKLGVGEIVGDVLTIDKNKDYVTERLYFGTAYDSAGTWNGRLYGLKIDNVDLATSWTPAPDAIFEGAFPFTASPDAASDTADNVWVYAGSGKYYSDVDEYYLDDQIFVGVKDQLTSPSYPVDVTTTGMDDKTTAQTAGTVTETEEICGYNAVDNKFEQQTVVTKTDRTSGEQTTPDIGWYVLLPDGERVISRPLAVGGLVDYLTYIPSSDECSYGGESYLYAVGYTTGEAPNKIAIRSSQTTGGATSGDVDISRGIRLGPGAPPTGEAIIIPPPKEGQDQLKKKIQVATGVIVEAENTPAISVTSEMVHWLKK
ncbi:MAG: hypothetical protein C0619_07335 [Desulfuromonas sp.]|nr:MAG: hypothetical protein C0619_07335 [Desulfuromonas sp.]